MVNPILAHFFFVVHNFICHQKNGETSHEQLSSVTFSFHIPGSHPSTRRCLPTVMRSSGIPCTHSLVGTTSQPMTGNSSTMRREYSYACEWIFPLCTKLGNSADCREGLMWGVSDLLPAISLSSSFTTVSCRCSCAAPENKSTPARESN